MIYLISQDWINTSNNHAGIKYLCNRLSTCFPSQYKSLVVPDLSVYEIRGGIFIQLLNYFIHSFYHRKELNRIYKSLKGQLKEGDVVFLMEYLDKGVETYSLATKLKKLNPKFRLFAMAHLVPAKFDRNFKNDTELIKWIEPVEKLFTLGTSLSTYLIKRGIDEAKIITTFHYVDDYYVRKDPLAVNESITVIAMGNQVRNIELLKLVVDSNPDTRFIICQGVYDMSKYFAKNDNVKLIPFVEEENLRRYMEQSDISLNVMHDTIGSNVIVTSLAMGLAMICSDVGSIRDYCDETNCLFCNNTTPEAFSKAISELQDRNKLLKMKEASLNRVGKLSIEEFHKFVQKIVNNE